jgi:SAM-dependent methyltransferase
MSVEVSTGQVWADAAGYEGYIGRWSSLVARPFLEWLDVEPGGRWLDVGCGTGALWAAVRERDGSARIAGIDRAPAFVAAAGERVPGGDFAVGDAQALPHGDGKFDAVVSGLVLNFVPEPERMAGELARVARSDGTVAAYVWDYAGGMELIRRCFEAARELDPAAEELDEGRRFPLCRLDRLEALFRGAGLTDVESQPIDIPTVFRDFDDYWQPFLAGQGPAPAYVVSLAPERRDALREHLRASLPVAADGSIPLTARALAVRGRR